MDERLLTIALSLGWIRVMATTFRALVMLSVLVGIPAAWVYYGPLPPEAQRVVDRVVGAAKEATGWAEPPAPVATTAPAAAHDSAAPSFTPTITAAASAAPVQASPLPAPKAPTFAERVEPLLARLRQLGVVAYDLELFGNSGNLYRFHCEMPLGVDAHVTQQFEAVAADPQESVAEVVAQISQSQVDRGRAGL
jgi:hypothetical protein